MSKAYSSNLTQAQWELLESLIPPAKPGGRPRRVEIWAVLNAILYVLTQGCTWRNEPSRLSQLVNRLHLLPQLAPRQNLD